MQVAVEIGKGPEARGAMRHPAATAADLRPFRSGLEPIEVIDISDTGCGFESRWPFREQMMVLLYLPGLEPWAATVRWWREGRGGIQFVRPLHPAVTDRFIVRLALG